MLSAAAAQPAGDEDEDVQLIGKIYLRLGFVFCVLAVSCKLYSIAPIFTDAWY